jgi:membrane protease YdiL (CAAX protease family)
MPYVLSDHILAAILVIAWPLYAGYVQFPRLKRELSLGLANTRVRAYVRAVLIQWTVAAAAVTIWIVNDRAFYELGIAATSGWRLGFGAIVLVAAAVLLEVQRRRVTSDPSLSAEFREKIANASPLLPTNGRELATFYLVSVTAGVCEELLYRGYLIWYLKVTAGLPAAVILSSMMFGMAHLYQGRKGMLQTGTIGLVFALLYIVTGSLWVPMALHMLVDMSSGTLWYQIRGVGDASPAPGDDAQDGSDESGIE